MSAIVTSILLGLTVAWGLAPLPEVRKYLHLWGFYPALITLVWVAGSISLMFLRIGEYWVASGYGMLFVGCIIMVNTLLGIVQKRIDAEIAVRNREYDAACDAEETAS